MPKILLIRFSSIGDIVLTTPVIRCIKQQIKEVELHYLAKKQFNSVLDSNPYIDKLHYYENNLKEAIADLKKEKFDYILDLHHNIRTLFIKASLGAKSFSFNKLNIEKWLMVNLKINQLPPVHIVDRYLATAKNLGVHNDGKGLDYFIPQKDEIDIKTTLPPTHHAGYFAFVIGAKHFTKQLPLPKLISICKKINHPIVLLGGKEDIEKGKEMALASGTLVFNGCGSFNLNQSASLVRQAQKVLTHDTGLMHIAAAFNKEVISLWGNTIPEFGMYPYKLSRSHIMEVQGLPCRPCSKIGFQQCPQKHFKCMELIDEEKIVELLKLKNQKT